MYGIKRACCKEFASEMMLMKKRENEDRWCRLILKVTDYVQKPIDRENLGAILLDVQFHQKFHYISNCKSYRVKDLSARN